MSHELTQLVPGKTYASAANCRRAVEKEVGDSYVRWLLAWNEEGRCYPIFLGKEALDLGLFFRGFICVS